MGNAEETSSLLLQVGETVRAILRRKSGLSLRDDDPRPENQEAVELVHDVILRLWERQSTTPGAAWDDLGSYAARVTYNAWSDHLREKYPKRASLKNRLRYFTSHQARYASWNASDGELLIGLHGWQLSSRVPVGDARVAAPVPMLVSGPVDRWRAQRHWCGGSRGRCSTAPGAWRGP